MTTLMPVFLIAAALVAALLMYAATRPDTFRVERSLEIKATPEVLFAQINDFKAWRAWSPWETRDPAMKRTFGSVTSGKGATYAWEGNRNVGSGSMEIVEASPTSKLRIKLDFIRPFEAHNTAEFTLRTSGGTTTVTWAMYGPSAFAAKLMGVFMNMDRMIGRDFEAGLAGLRSIAEKP